MPISGDMTELIPQYLRSFENAMNGRGVESFVSSSSGRDAGRKAAAKYGDKYMTRPGAMVFDVVASRQRRYEMGVLPLVGHWESDASASSRNGSRRTLLRPVVTDCEKVNRPRWLRWLPICEASLLTRRQEDDVCRTWANRVHGLEHAPGLDPIVGSVKGIGLVLFAYMRMRTGGDALKADLRVTRGLRLLGFQVPGSVHATLVIARAVAEEIGTNLLVLDQLLGLDDREGTVRDS
jgi:hypothetical protein